MCFPYNKHETNRNDIEPHERSSLYSDKNRTHKSTHFGGKHAHISAIVGNREDLFRTLRFHSQMLLTQHNTNNQKNTLQNRESVNEEGKSFYHYPKTCAAIKCCSWIWLKLLFCKQRFPSVKSHHDLHSCTSSLFIHILCTLNKKSDNCFLQKIFFVFGRWQHE